MKSLIWKNALYELPKHNNNVLLYVESERGNLYCISAYRDDWQYPGYCKNDHVVAWCELPEKKIFKDFKRCT
jgi:hypothetical protein